MSKILKATIGFVVVGAAIGLAASSTKATPVKIPAKATSVKAESKASQCKRLNQTMTEYYKKMMTLDGIKETDDVNIIFDQIIQAEQKNRQRFQGIKFSDPKILRIQQSILSAGITRDKDWIAARNAFVRDDEKEFQAIYMAMALRQVESGLPAYDYCKWPVVGKTIEIRMRK